MKTTGISFILALLIAAAGCGQSEDAVKVSLLTGNGKAAEPARADNNEKIRIAIGAIVSPRKTFVLYENLFDFIGKKLGRPIELIQRNTYTEVNYLIKENKVDAAFICSLPYVEGTKEFGIELLVAPVCFGKPEYYSYIIVHKSSPIDSIEGLRGKTFAFTDTISNTGALFPIYMLARMNETPLSFFREYVYTYSHDNSIKSVAEKIVDGAAVDNLIWEYENKNNPVYTSSTKIICKSEPFGIPPVVVPANIDPELKHKLKTIFLGLHDNEEGRKILSMLMIDKFVEIDDSRYDSIRSMRDFTASFKQPKKQ